MSFFKKLFKIPAKVISSTVIGKKPRQITRKIVEAPLDPKGALKAPLGLFGSKSTPADLSLSAPDTDEEIAIRQVQERDRMMMQSIQALAMDRLRNSIRSLSRENQFQSRQPIEQFSYSPLYIPNQNEE